jgi:O-antigen ligase
MSATGNILLLLYLRGYDNMGLAERTANRVQIQSGREVEIDTAFINPIWIGQVGAALALISLGFLVYKIKPKLWLFHFASLVCGLANVVFSASRGPLIFMFLSIGVILLKSLAIKGRRTSSAYILLIITLGFFTSIKYLQEVKVSGTQVLLIDRIVNFLFLEGGREREARDDLLEEAWHQFLVSPIYGDQFVLRNGGGYPHNILLEVLMATGIVGATIFGSALVLCLSAGLKELRRTREGNNVIAVSLAFFFIMSGMTSGSIYVNPEIWLSLSLLSVIALKINLPRKIIDRPHAV